MNKFFDFFAETKPYGFKGLYHEILKIVFDSAEIFDFSTFPRMLSQR
jgi:hypothetical protein